MKGINIDEIPDSANVMINEGLREILRDIYLRERSYSKASYLVGIDRRILADFITGKISLPSGKIIKRLAKYLGKEKIGSHINEIKSHSEYTKFCRKSYFSRATVRSVDLNDIICKNNGNLFIDFEKWLSLSNYIMSLKTTTTIKDVKFKNLPDKMVISYYIPSNKKSCKVILPKKIEIDNEFLYWLGLWLGDRDYAGISSKDFCSLKITRKVLSGKLLQPAKDIYGIVNLVNLPKKEANKYVQQLKANVKVKRIVVKQCNSKNVDNGIGFSIRVTNHALFRVLDCIKNDIEALLASLNSESRGFLYAGFFDAEGFVGRKRISWTQKKDKKLIKTIENFLKKDGYNVRVDSREIRIGHGGSENKKHDFELFKNQIYPNVKTAKKNGLEELLEYYHHTLNSDYIYLLYIKLHPCTSKQLQIEFKNKIDSIRHILRALYVCGYIRKEEMKYYITKKGIDSLNERKKSIMEMINQAINGKISHAKIYKNKKLLREIRSYL